MCGNGATEKVIASGLDQLRRTMADLAHLDPRSSEVREWFDRAYDAVSHVDEVEGIVLRMHQRYLLDPAEKIIASAEIAEIVDRAARVSEILKRVGIHGSLT